MLAQLNLIVDDMEASLDFFRRLGVSVPDACGDWPEGSGARHAGLSGSGRTSLELDNTKMARIWHAAWRAGPGHGGRCVIGFSLPTREAVDERYGELTAAGYAGCQPPYDAFWGARYAIVHDPDGNDIGLMSPVDPQRKFVPSPDAAG